MVLSDVEIREETLSFRLAGKSMKHVPGVAYGVEILRLLDGVWPVLRVRGTGHDGINRVLYDADGVVFAGVVVSEPDDLGLEVREVGVDRYACVKHTGPYSGLGTAYAAIEGVLREKGLRHGYPLMEVYGHWTQDEWKLETEVIFPLAG